MPKTIIVVGFGPGISRAVAERFGEEGFCVALIGRSAERLDAGVAALQAKGVTAAAFPADAGDPAALRAAIAKASAELGPVTILHWNTFGGGGGGGDTRDLLAADPADVRALFDVSILGLLAAVDQALPDLKAAGDGAVLISNGGFGLLSPQMDSLAVKIGVMGMALANGAKQKLAGLLSERLKADGVYVGEVMVAGNVTNPTSPPGHKGIESSAIAEAFWTLYQNRSELRALVSL